MDASAPGKRVSAMDDLFEELAHKGVLAGDDVLKRAIEDKAALGEHQEGCGRVRLAFWEGNHATLVAVEMMSAHGERVLKAMRDQQ